MPKQKNSSRHTSEFAVRQHTYMRDDYNVLKTKPTHKDENCACVNRSYASRQEAEKTKKLLHKYKIADKPRTAEHTSFFCLKLQTQLSQNAFRSLFHHNDKNT